MFGISITCTSVFAQESSSTVTSLITVNTDRSSYNIGDTINISGQLLTPDEGQPVVIQVLDPKDHAFLFAKAYVSEGGNFTDTVTAVGALWRPSGTYTVKVSGPNDITAETTFQFSGYQIQTSPLTSSPTTTPSIIPTPKPPTQPTPTSPTPTPQAPDSTVKIPHWVKSLFGLYGQGQVSDNDLINALKFLIQTGVIKIS